jgi:hypothetical protein
MKQNKWMKQQYVLKKLNITIEQLNKLVNDCKIMHRHLDNVYLRSDVEAIKIEMKNDQHL